MPRMTASRVLPAITSTALALQYTRFSSWFPQYRRHTPKATVIDSLSLQADFLDWLEEDGIILPQDSEDDQRQDSADDSDDDVGSLEEDDDMMEPRRFDALNEKIRHIISGYDGAVFPKLDWSAPLDAAWIVPGSTLRCTTPSDIYLLLKSSDFVTKDVKQLRELDTMQQQLVNQSDETLRNDYAGLRPMLVLKKFFSIPTSHEFRCFVRAGHFLCISQRDCGTFFEHLQDPITALKMRQLLQTFFQTVLGPLQEADEDRDRLQSPRCPFPIQDFVWDAYISRDLSKVFLVDMNPYLERTDSLLWTWEEIEELAGKKHRGESISDRDDEDGGEEDSSDEETVMRIFTDGREPVLLQMNDNTNGEGQQQSRPRRQLPLLRTVTSRAQTTQSFPTYARNMVPSDVVGAAEGNSIAEFAREWNSRIAQTTRDSIDDGSGSGDEDGEVEQPNLLPGR